MNHKILKTIIVDDEPLAIEGLKIRLENFPEINVVGECVNGEEAIKKITELKPDLVFLDLEMPGISGLEVVQAIDAELLPMIILVTAYKQYAVEAFELNVVDYILKPINLGRLKQAVEKACDVSDELNKKNKNVKLLKALHEVSGVDVATLEEWLNSDDPLPSNYPDKIAIKDSNNNKMLIEVSAIKWVDAAGDYMCIHVGNETHILRVTMKKLGEILNPKLFQRIHKSTIINISFIKKLEPLKNSECNLVLDGGVELKVSRNYSSNIKTILGQLSV